MKLARALTVPGPVDTDASCCHAAACVLVASGCWLRCPADAEGQPRKRRSFRKKLSSGLKRTFVEPFKKSSNASDEVVRSAAASAQAAPSAQ